MTLIDENRSYWSKRVSGYSDVNKIELSGMQRDKWKDFLREIISEHFGGKRAEEIKVLDIGTGPGFFAIILTEAGFDVTAVDLTPQMLDEAKRNAGDLEGRIHFMEMNAQDLSFGDQSFDVVLSRNLTWNLPEPETAYKEWVRVLKYGGMLLNFDANWYSYLFDEQARKAFEEDRTNTASTGIKDENIGENFDVMEDIARRVPLSGIRRPDWDIRILTGLGMTVYADIDVWEKVWSGEEKINFASTPLFMVMAVKESSVADAG